MATAPLLFPQKIKLGRSWKAYEGDIPETGLGAER
jgi:hypothetical protein